MKNNRILLNILPALYLLFAFISIHTINNIYFYFVSLGLAIYFLLKKYLRLSCSIFTIMVVLVPTWLFFNNIFYERALHYTIISDLLTVFIISVIYTLVNIKKEFKFNIVYIVIALISTAFCQYCAYDNCLYWFIISSLILCGLGIFKKEYEKSSNKKYLLLLIVIYFISSVYYVIDNYIPIKADKIAVLKSDWCNVANMPDNKSHQINYYYAYSDFMKILNGYGKTTIINNQDIENNTKLDYDVIILITPTEPISKVQVKKLDNFVKNGGRLVLITDHTNLYGHIDSVHGLLQNFGTRMNDDAVFNANNYYEKALLNINSIQLNKIMMKTGNSIIPPVTSKVWAITPTIISEKADYTRDNFFGELIFSSDDCVGNFPIGVTIRKGLGSFVIWNDSTLFSNFAISQENNIQLLDYIVRNKIYTSKTRNIVYKYIKIYTDIQDVFWEAPPNRAPSELHYSTLIANFTRNHLFPEYTKNYESDLVFTTYDNLLNQFSKLKADKVVIIDDIPENNCFNVKKYSFGNNEITSSNNNFYYSVNGNTINTIYNKKDIVFAKNVLSDNELGAWWNTTDISPYKKEMINEFLNWLNDGSEIKIFHYPKTTCKQENYLIKFNDGTQEYWNNICLSNMLKIGNNNIVYLGNRRWAFVVPNGTFLGTPELSDNYANSLNLRWVAKRTNNYIEKQEKVRKGCIINRFSIGTKHPAP